MSNLAHKTPTIKEGRITSHALPHCAPHDPSLLERCDVARAHLKIARLAATRDRGKTVVRREIMRARSEIRTALKGAKTLESGRSPSTVLVNLVHLVDELRSLSAVASS